MKRRLTKQGFDKNEYETPQKLFEWLNNIYDFHIDLACTQFNEKIKKSFAKHKGNALNIDWHKLSEFWLWCNPPYKPLKPWIKKAYIESKLGAGIVMLVPLDTLGTIYYQEYKANRVFIFQGRINFEYKGHPIKGNDRCSCLLIYDTESDCDQLDCDFILRNQWDK